MLICFQISQNTYLRLGKTRKHVSTAFGNPECYCRVAEIYIYIFFFLETKLGAGNNVSRVAKLGKLGKHAQAMYVSGNMIPRLAGSEQMKVDVFFVFGFSRALASRLTI